MSENNSYSSQSLIWKCHECGKYYGNVMNVRKQSLKSVSITSIENKKTKESRMKKPCLKRISTASKAYSIDGNVNLHDEEFPGFGSSLVITTCVNTNQKLEM